MDLDRTDVMGLHKDEVVKFFTDNNIEFDKKDYKPKLIQDLLSLANKDNNLRTKLLQQFPVSMAIPPAKVMLLLDCTKAEQRRWTDEKKIVPLEYITIKHNITFPVYDRLVIEAVTQEQMQQWRDEYKELVKANRKVGTEKAKATRQTAEYKEKQNIKKKFRIKHKDFVVKYENDKDAVKNSMELAYWFSYLYRHVHCHMKIYSGDVSYIPISYNGSKNLFLTYRQIFVQSLTLLTTFPWFKVMLCQPSNNNRITNVHLCKSHYNQWKEDGIGKFYPQSCFVIENEEAIQQCPHCKKTVEINYRAILLVEVEEQYKFFIPYWLVRDEIIAEAFVTTDVIPSEVFVPLTKTEEVAMPLSTVVKNVKKSLETLSGYLRLL